MSTKQLLLLLHLTFIAFGFSQEKNFIKHNDSLVGQENLAYNNGLVYFNKYKITSENTSQFFENKYNVGNVHYNNQMYYDISIKYDVFEDVLLFKPNAQLALETYFISKQVDYFILKNIKFKKLETISSDNSIKIGFFEENNINQKFTLYVKHKKNIKVIASSDKISNKFYDSKTYYIFFDNKLNEISSKKSIINLFPELKKEIKQFYRENNNLKETNIQLFYQNLFKTIN